MAKMVSRETLLVGILAIITGLITAAGVRSYLSGLEEKPLPAKQIPPQPVTVLVASMDLPADKVISSYDINAVQMPPQVFKERFKNVDPEQLIARSAIILKRRIKEPLKRGEPFLTTSFYLEGTGPSVAEKLKPGFRAVRVLVPVTREAAVRPGMFVDVMFRSKAKPARPDSLAIPEKTLTLLKNIEVLESERPGSHGHMTGQERNQWYFTLAIPEDKAEYFSIIENRGDLWLVPTPADGDNPKDGTGTAVANVATLAALLGVTPPHQPPAPFETAIYRRGNVQVNKFVDGKLLTTRYHERPTWRQQPTTSDSPASLPEEKE